MFIHLRSCPIFVCTYFLTPFHLSNFPFCFANLSQNQSLQGSPSISVSFGAFRSGVVSLVGGWSPRDRACPSVIVGRVWYVLPSSSNFFPFSFLLYCHIHPIFFPAVGSDILSPVFTSVANLSMRRSPSIVLFSTEGFRFAFADFAGSAASWRGAPCRWLIPTATRRSALLSTGTGMCSPFIYCHLDFFPIRVSNIPFYSIDFFRLCRCRGFDTV